MHAYILRRKEQRRFLKAFCGAWQIWHSRSASLWAFRRGAADYCEGGLHSPFLLLFFLGSVVAHFVSAAAVSIVVASSPVARSVFMHLLDLHPPPSLTGPTHTPFPRHSRRCGRERGSAAPGAPGAASHPRHPVPARPLQRPPPLPSLTVEHRRAAVRGGLHLCGARCVS